MRPWRWGSLRAQLTWRMVLMQALVLMAFTGVAAVPIYMFLSDDQRFDDNVVEDIAQSVHYSADGTMALVPTGGLQEKTAEHPALWFYVFDSAGTSIQQGNIPARIVPMQAALKGLSSANMAGSGPHDETAAILRRVEGAMGPLWIVTGGGPEIGFKSVFGNPLFVGLLVLLTLVSFLVIPLVVRHLLRGVTDVAAEANAIDVEQRGIRLSSMHVPDELHPLVRAINAALQRLDDGIERRQRFLADAAHELRTPIAILQTRIELLPGDALRSRLMLDVGRLATLANQLLDLERLDADTTVFQPINLVELAGQVTADMAPLAVAAGNEISFDAEADRVMVSADAASLSRALVNLVQNAVVHGGPKTAIRVAVGRDGAVRVADTGPGIPHEHRRAIFEPFNRVVPLDQGAGLGLKLVQDIVHRHNGQITVGDAPGGGALFEISLPLHDGAVGR